MGGRSASVTLHSIDAGKPIDERRFTLAGGSKMPIGRSSLAKASKEKPGPRTDNAYLDDPYVSRLHAELSCNKTTGILSVVDLQSMHGTSVNGKPLQPHQPTSLANGDIITIGDSVNGTLNCGRSFLLRYRPISPRPQTPAKAPLACPPAPEIAKKPSQQIAEATAFVVPDSSDGSHAGDLDSILDHDSGDEDLQFVKIVPKATKNTRMRSLSQDESIVEVSRIVSPDPPATGVKNVASLDVSQATHVVDEDYSGAEDEPQNSNDKNFRGPVPSDHGEPNDYGSDEDWYPNNEEFSWSDDEFQQDADETELVKGEKFGQSASLEKVEEHNQRVRAAAAAKLDADYSEEPLDNSMMQPSSSRPVPDAQAISTPDKTTSHSFSTVVSEHVTAELEPVSEPELLSEISVPNRHEASEPDEPPQPENATDKDITVSLSAVPESQNRQASSLDNLGSVPQVPSVPLLAENINADNPESLMESEPRINFGLDNHTSNTWKENHRPNFAAKLSASGANHYWQAPVDQTWDHQPWTFVRENHSGCNPDTSNGSQMSPSHHLNPPVVDSSSGQFYSSAPAHQTTYYSIASPMPHVSSDVQKLSTPSYWCPDYLAELHRRQKFVTSLRADPSSGSQLPPLHKAAASHRDNSTNDKPLPTLEPLSAPICNNPMNDRQPTTVEQPRTTQNEPMSSTCKVSISSIVDPVPLESISGSTGTKRKWTAAEQEKTAQPIPLQTARPRGLQFEPDTVTINNRTTNAGAGTGTSAAPSSSAPEGTAQIIFKDAAVDAPAEPPRKRARTSQSCASSFGSFMLGALVGGIGVIGALVSLPESYF